MNLDSESGQGTFPFDPSCQRFRKLHSLSGCPNNKHARVHYERLVWPQIELLCVACNLTLDICHSGWVYKNRCVDFLWTDHLYSGV